MSTEARPPSRRPAPLPVLIAVLGILLVTTVHAAVWTPVAPMNFLRAAHGAAALNGKVYAIGGDNGGYVYTLTAEVYDPGTDSWSNIATMPNNKGELAVVGLGNKLYAIGGWESISSNSVYIYHPGTNSWTIGPPLNLGRRGLCAAVSGGKIYVMGGWNGNSRNDVEVFDPATNTWSYRAPMNLPHYSGAAAATSDGKIYVMGGHAADGSAQAAEVYNPATNTWSMIAPLNIQRYVCAATRGADDRIYVMGGSSPAGAASSVEVYDPGTNSWSYVPPMTIPRQYFAAATLGDKMYAIGGSNSTTSHLRSAEVYTSADVTAPTCVLNPVVPNASATQVYVPITVSDSGRGIHSITLTNQSANCRLECYRDAAHTQPLGIVGAVGGTLTLGTFEPVVYVKALKNSGSRSRVELLVSDGALSIRCDPVIAELKISRGARRITRAFKGIPDFEHYVTLQNSSPGLSGYTVTVNGRQGGKGRLTDGQTVTLNVQHLMRAGKNNRVQVTATGSAGSKAILVIADAPQTGSEHPHAPVNQEFTR